MNETLSYQTKTVNQKIRSIGGEMELPTCWLNPALGNHIAQNPQYVNRNTNRPDLAAGLVGNISEASQIGVGGFPHQGRAPRMEMARPVREKIDLARKESSGELCFGGVADRDRSR